jgi:hypothetical protein
MRQVFATEGWLWARAARRRFDAVNGSASTAQEIADSGADLAQGIEALDRALRFAARVLSGVPGTSLPPGIDWDAIRRFARRGRNAVAHGDERLADPGLGYSVRIESGVVIQHGKARGDDRWQTDRLPFADLAKAAKSLEDWFRREIAIA